MTTPTDVTFSYQATVIPSSWLNGVNDWVYGAYGLLGEVFDASTFRDKLGLGTRSITSSSDISLQDIASAYDVVGTGVTMTIPTSGAISLVSFAGRLTETGGAATIGLYVGIRVNGTNYWFGQNNTNGTTTNFTLGTATTSTYKEWKGSASPGATMTDFVLDIQSNGITTGSQTVELIAAKGSAGAGTLTGATTTTRAVIQIISTQT